jgi:LysM repeat protein/lysophospholipase L1-like esterase
MQKKFIIFFLLICVGFQLQAQKVDSVSVAVDTLPIIIPENLILNPNAIFKFYSKLDILERTKSGKINIVHVGDSHIQADLMTSRTRKNLQAAFGNGGRGFVFPHKLAKTNGSWDVKFTSNATWESYKNIHPINGTYVGISGIALSTKSRDFGIDVTVKDKVNYFNTIKVITPNNENTFVFSFDKKEVMGEVVVPTTSSHKVVKGDVISKIAKKYGVTIDDIKKLNNLKSSEIKAGETLIIGKKSTQKLVVECEEYLPVASKSDENYHYYTSKEPIGKISIIPTNTEFQNEYNLNGLVLENNSFGILYHNIGINGAKFSDYNKHPLFFEQLKALNPDLIIVSLGTNESFNSMNSDDFMAQLNLFIQKAKAQNMNVEILITTPQPSQFQKKNPNEIVADYSQKIIEKSSQGSYAVWDMFGQLGGIRGLLKNKKDGILSQDGVHYTVKGYEKQGKLLSEAIINSFKNFKK